VEDISAEWRRKATGEEENNPLCGTKKRIRKSKEWSLGKIGKSTQFQRGNRDSQLQNREGPFRKLSGKDVTYKAQDLD